MVLVGNVNLVLYMSLPSISDTSCVTEPKDGIYFIHNCSMVQITLWSYCGASPVPWKNKVSKHSGHQFASFITYSNLFIFTNSDRLK